MNLNFIDIKEDDKRRINKKKKSDIINEQFTMQN